MQLYKLCRWPLLLSIFCILGCSSLHIDTSSTLDWKTVAAVTLLEPDQDRWGLAPAIRAELDKIGFEVLSEGTGDPDLNVRFSAKEGSDLDAEGNQTLRLLSVHIQFVIPVTGNVVSKVDYLFPVLDGLSEPANGLKSVFAELQKEIEAASSVQVQVDQKDIPEPAATSLPPREENGSIVKEKTLIPKPSKQLPQTTEQEKVSSTSIKKTEIPQQVVSSQTKKPEALDKKTETQSSWLPRLQTWGFDTWGAQTNNEY